MHRGPLVGPSLARLALLALPLVLSACGQTGALYLPEDEGATVVTRPAGAATSPATTPAAAEATTATPSPAATSPDSSAPKPPSAATPPTPARRDAPEAGPGPR